MKEIFVESITLFLCLGRLKMPFLHSWLTLVRNRAPLRAASVEGVCCEGAGVSHGTEEPGTRGRGCGNGTSSANRSVCLSCQMVSRPSFSWGQCPTLVVSVDWTCLLFEHGIRMATQGTILHFLTLNKKFSHFLTFRINF